MLCLIDEEWNSLFDKVDETIQKAIADLPPKIQDADNEIICLIYKSLERKMNSCMLNNE